MTTHHVCFSGSPACSGCNPCEACQFHVRSCVLPVAMTSGGFHQNGIEQILYLLTPVAGMHGNIQEALRVAMVHRAPDQAEAFFRGYAAGWQRLHDAMMKDPVLQKQYIARDVREVQSPPAQGLIEPGLAAQQAQQAYQQAQQAQIDPQVHQAYVYPPQNYPIDSQDPRAHQTLNGAMPVQAQPTHEPALIDQIDLQKPIELDVMKKLLDEAEKKQGKGGGSSVAPVVEPIANPRVRNMVKPMDPEEIAAAAAPVILGDVMNSTPRSSQ